MEGSVSVVEDVGAPPESWEVADVDASMRRLLLSSSKKNSGSQSDLADSQDSASNLAPASSSSAPGSSVSEDAINSVDQFLREALQNPRERLSVLRMEQDVEKFMRDPSRQQMEFQQLPTSYLRLAAHRVAQHYSLTSMVLVDNPDGSGSRIIVCKSSESRMPSIRLADIPINLPQEDTSVIKVAIKQRPQRGSQFIGSNSQSLKNNSSKSVEERKEEYNRARARIFSSNNLVGTANGKTESESKMQDTSQHVSQRMPRVDEKASSAGSSEMNIGRGSLDSSTGSNRTARSRTEKEQIGRSKTSNRVAIFRDREIDRKDPDYDRNYDRYLQRFDPGFGFTGGPYAIQPMYAPALNYNTEFPQLGSTHRPPISAEHQPCPLPPRLPGPWVAPSPPGIAYGRAETMIPPFNANHVGMRSNSALYLHSTQYPCQRPGMPFIHHHEQIQVPQPFTQSHHQQPDASFGLARPR
nr:R3H domain-containing protein 1-like [Ipomoea batatas]GMD57297.1 R3H domain-containing protein 1-like [Ipomoea batatas]GMD58929.1 R3H domain-containing protein 1-like [Ipomoea batatas]